MSASTPAEHSGRPRGSRWLGRLLWVLVVLLAAASTLVGFFLSPLADVESVDVIGIHRLTLDEIEAELGFEPGVALLRLDFAAAHAALTRLPWFYDASFERSWRGVVTVRVVEQRPVALALHGSGGWVVVSAEGRVLSEPLATPPPLPRLAGIATAPALGQYLPDRAKPLLTVSSALSSSRVAHDELWLDNRSDIWLLLHSGDRVVLGDNSRLATKLAALSTLLAQPTPSFGERELDVSIPHLPVIRSLQTDLSARE